MCPSCLQKWSPPTRFELVGFVFEGGRSWILSRWLFWLPVLYWLLSLCGVPTGQTTRNCCPRPRIATEWLDKMLLSSLWLCFIQSYSSCIYWIYYVNYCITKLPYLHIYKLLFVTFWETFDSWWQSIDCSYYGLPMKSRSPKMSFCFDSPLRGVICQSCSPAINALLQPERRKTCRLWRILCVCECTRMEI